MRLSAFSHFAAQCGCSGSKRQKCLLIAFYVVASFLFTRPKLFLFSKQRNHFEMGSNNARRISNNYAFSPRGVSRLPPPKFERWGHAERWGWQVCANAQLVCERVEKCDRGRIGCRRTQEGYGSGIMPLTAVAGVLAFFVAAGTVQAARLVQRSRSADLRQASLLGRRARRLASRSSLVEEEVLSQRPVLSA